MKKTTSRLTIGLALAAGSVQAAGPLFLWEGGETPRPYTWDTSNGAIPVYTDGGPADINGVPTFTFNADGETAFLTIERADEITGFGFDQWNAVETSTFAASVVDTIESKTGIADVTGANANEIYGVENGYGFFVNYDTDGSILEDYFGVSRSQVLGIAFPEWADETTGEITEATAVMNGWFIYDTDVNGDRAAGVFTHEFGHAINLSHTQVNGDLAYAPSYVNRNAAPGSCDAPSIELFDQIETMFPFISTSSPAGEAQSTVNVTDDKVAISNLYPTVDYHSSTGSISGVLLLKDGKTPYSGVNIIARNVNDWFFDAVSAQSGDQTQGLVGPDGRFTINGLTPGESYVLYTNEIWQGGFPTAPQPIISQGEYWNVSESNDPATDDICDATPIVAEAGVTKNADLVFNGYLDGVQYTPIVSAYLLDMAKNGKSASGQAGTTAFKWDENKNFIVLPPSIKAGNVTMNRNGQVMTVMYDFDGDGIAQAALFDFNGSKKGDLVDLGDLNGDSCGGSGQSGINSSYPWDVDAAGHTVVGTAYLDTDNDGFCQSSSKGEIVPFIWTKGKKGGMRMLATENAPRPTSFLRAHAVSGNGEVILGNNGGSAAVAWVNEGPLVDLYNAPYKTRDAYAVNYAGTRVALSTYNDGPILWNPFEDSFTEIGNLQWCSDMPYVSFFLGNLCQPNRVCPEGCTPEFIETNFGPVPLIPLDMNDEGTVIIGRAGSFFTGFAGGIYVEGLGWMNLADFFRKQGVTEAFDFPMDNPISIDGSGDKLVGGLAGAQFSWHVDMSEVFVCLYGVDIATGFPEGAVDWIRNGAEFGRCAFID
jgi:hypothetical protein